MLIKKDLWLDVRKNLKFKAIWPDQRTNRKRPRGIIHPPVRHSAQQPQKSLGHNKVMGTPKPKKTRPKKIKTFSLTSEAASMNLPSNLGLFNLLRATYLVPMPQAKPHQDLLALLGHKTLLLQGDCNNGKLYQLP